MSYVSDLHNWLLNDLRVVLELSYPEVVAEFDTQRRLLAEDELLSFDLDRLDFEAPQPWCDLISAVVGLRVGILELEFCEQSLKEAADGRAAWFYQEMLPMVASSCLEGLEYIVKRMERSGLVEKEVADHLVKRLEEERTRAPLEPLRHDAAHGPHRGLGKGGWIDAPTEERLWEICALNREPGDGSVEELFHGTFARRDFRAAVLGGVVVKVNEFIENICARLLTSARSQAPRSVSPEPG